jgi:hypothetical protein
MLGDIVIMAKLSECLSSVVQERLIKEFSTVVVEAEDSCHGRHNLFWQQSLEHGHKLTQDLVDGLEFVIANAELAAQVPLRLLDRWDRRLGRQARAPAHLGHVERAPLTCFARRRLL